MGAKIEITLAINLRPWTAADLWLLQRLMGDPATTVYLGGPETPEQITERHMRYLRTDELGRGTMFVIMLGSKRMPVGTMGYWERTWHSEHLWELGWCILPEYRGYGIARMAINEVILRAKQQGKHRFIHTFPAVEDDASNAVCRMTDFKFIGTEEFEYTPGRMMSCNNWRLDLFEAAGRD